MFDYSASLTFVESDCLWLLLLKVEWTLFYLISCVCNIHDNSAWFYGMNAFIYHWLFTHGAGLYKNYKYKHSLLSLGYFFIPIVCIVNSVSILASQHVSKLYLCHSMYITHCFIQFIWKFARGETKLSVITSQSLRNEIFQGFIGIAVDQKPLAGEDFDICGLIYALHNYSV